MPDISLEDRIAAMEAAKAPSRFDTPSFIAVALVLSMVGLTFTLVFVEIPKDSDVLKLMIGGLMTSGFTAIVGFYFGSSSGSKAKDEVQAQAQTQMVGLLAGTGPGNGAAAKAALAAPAVIAAAATVAAKPAAEVAAPPAAEAAVEKELAERGITPKERP